MLFVDVIAGLTQDEGHANGCIQLEERLLAATDDYSGLSVRIHYNQWNANWRQVAFKRYMKKQQYPRERFGHVVCCYSYGGGHGLVKFANQLNRYGMKIHVAVTCDAIYRHAWMKWRSLYGDHSILLPENVLAFWGFYQRKSRPMGVKPTGSAVELGWEKLEVIHVEADDQVAWHDKCAEVVLDMAKKYVDGPDSVPKDAPITEAVESRLANK